MDAAQARDRCVGQRGHIDEHLRPATALGDRQQQLGRLIGQSRLGQGAFQADEVAQHKRLQQAATGRLGHLRAGHQRREQRRVAQADPVILQAGRVERVAEHRERLHGALGSGRADQLDARLQQLARLPALGAHAAVAVGEVAEAQWRLARRVARGGHAGDRHGHVRAQHEHRTGLVEHTVGRPRFGHVRTREHRLVLERRRVHLAVAVALEHRAQGVGDGANLARLIR